MEGRGGRVRGGQWRRGGGSGGQPDSGTSGTTGERRGRGRGGHHHRGRGKRDHYRGRGRGADFNNRGQDEQDDKENFEEEMPDIYSRRKLESNWDRYEESEKADVNDDVPVQRGTDYHVLLSSAGDSFTQFRFSEEKDWEMDALAVNQVPATFVDLEVLAQSLQELPLHKRLNLEAELIQETIPVELPAVGVLHKVDPNVTGGFKAPAPAHMGQEPRLGGSCLLKSGSGTSMSLQASAAVNTPVDDADEELDLLLCLQKPITELSLANSQTSNQNGGKELSTSPEKVAATVVKEREDDVVEEDQVKAEEEDVRHQQKAEESKPNDDKVKQEMTEEDLEDWLDSMIS